MTDQPELDGIPEKGPLHDACTKLVQAYELLSEQKESVSNIKEKIMPMMKKQKRLQIKFNGYVIKYRETAEGITIAKEPNKE